MTSNKRLFFLFGAACFLVLLVIVVVISSLLIRPAQKAPFEGAPTPTAIPYTRNSQGTFIFTPLQRTVINKTTDREVEQENHVISKSQTGDVTIYTVDSNTVGETDEIRTTNGLVVFERTNIFNKKAGTYPPKISVYEKEFGEPEKILKGVSPLGKFISAYIYAKDGFTLFVNPNTDTVYVIQRYTPMGLETYEKTYPEYLKPAPAYPKEGFRP